MKVIGYSAGKTTDPRHKQKPESERILEIVGKIEEQKQMSQQLFYQEKVYTNYLKQNNFLGFPKQSKS